MRRLGERRGLGRRTRRARRRDTWVSVALTYQGLEALGVPQDSLDSFAWEFQQGMAARAKALGDTGESSPEHWETAARDERRPRRARRRSRRTSEQLEAALERAREALRGRFRGSRRSGARTATRCPPAGSPSGSGTASAIRPSKGAAFPARNPREQPLKAGEFVLGYPDETGGLPPMPRPEVLGRNGTYVVFRKLHQRVAAFRQYLKENARSAGRRGAAGGEDDGALAQRRAAGAVPLRTTTRSWAPTGSATTTSCIADDPTGYKTPPGSHIRRANPRDASVAGVVRLHRMIRRGTAYGPELPGGRPRGRRRRSRA